MKDSERILVSEIEGYKEAFDLLRTFFPDKTVCHVWMMTKNPMLGNVSPIDMLLVGRKKKLVQFIKTQLSENKR